jgi:hypothetical protein
MPWTEFMDMMLGSRERVGSYTWIYIDLPKDEAIEQFKSSLGVDPTSKIYGNNIYAIWESDDIHQATGFARGCKWDPVDSHYIEEDGGNTLDPYMTLEEFFAKDDVCVIRTGGQAFDSGGCDK